MTNFKLEELLPEKFEIFKSQIPDLKISSALATDNPFKPLLKHLENHASSGNLFKAIAVLLLSYLTLIVVIALCQKHPSAPAMLLLLLPVYGVTFLSWRKSPLAPYSLAQILLPFRVYPLLSKAFKQARSVDDKIEIAAQKPVNLVLFNKFFFKGNLGCLKRICSPEEMNLERVKRVINRIFTDRVIIFYSLAAFLIAYYQIAFYLNEGAYNQHSNWQNFVNDLTFVQGTFGPKIFPSFFLISLLAINFILYSGNIFLPSEICRILKFALGKPQSKFAKYIYLPLFKLIYLIAVIIFLLFAFSLVPGLYASEMTSPNGIVIIAVFLAIFVIIRYSFIFLTSMLRKLSLIVNRFYHN